MEGKSGKVNDKTLTSASGAMEDGPIIVDSMEWSDDGDGARDNPDGHHHGDEEKPVVVVSNEPFEMQENEQLKKELSQVKGQLKKKEKDNRKLEKRLAHFVKAYPDFERMRRELKSLSKEEKVLWELAKRNKTLIDEKLSKMMEMKQDQFDLLTRKVEKLKRAVSDEEGYSNIGGKDAISILPEEMWDLILKNVTDAKDLWSCSNTCGLFKKLLHDWKKPTQLFKQTFPLLFQYLPQNQILKCRSVSKGWNMVVDEYLENHPSQRPQYQDDYDSRMLPFINPMQEKGFWRLNRFDFRPEDHLMQRSGFPNVPGRNPFLGRAVALLIGRNKEILRKYRKKACWDRVYSFLKTYGKYIWYLTLSSFEDSRYEDRNLYQQQRLAQFLTHDLFPLVPNLRKLTIVPSGYEDSQNLGNFRRSHAQIVIGPVPAAPPKLETIQVVMVKLNGDLKNSKDSNAIALLEGYSAKLEALHVGTHLWRTVRLREWSNLKELYLDGLVGKEDFQSLGETKLPNLTKLGVNLKRRQLSFDWLLDLLHKQLAVRTLRLCGGFESNMFKRIRWSRCLSPALKTLEVEHYRYCGDLYYQFLRYFPLVENVHLFRKLSSPSDQVKYDDVITIPSEQNVGEYSMRMKPEEDWLANIKVDLHRFIDSGNLYDSNVWDLMPRLKLLTYQWDVYSRAGKEQFLREKIKRRFGFYFD